MTQICVWLYFNNGIVLKTTMSADLNECIENQVLTHFKLNWEDGRLKDFKWE